MKGNPPFKRKSARREFLTLSSAGLGPMLRAAARRPLLRKGCHLLLKTPCSVWLVTRPAASLRVGMRLIHESNGFGMVQARSTGSGIELVAKGPTGKHRVRIRFGEDDPSGVRVTTTLTTARPLRVAATPRDGCLLDARLEPLEEGRVHTHQNGPTAGQAFVSADGLFVFYFQNLSALGPYSRMAEVNLAGTVGAEWPEFGMCLPQGEKPVPEGRELVLSDAFLRMNQGDTDSDAEAALRFMEDLHETYLALSPSRPAWHDLQKRAADTLHDLSRTRACSRKLRGRTFINAYVGSTDKPPESMVQAALLVPLMEYTEFTGRPAPLLGRLEGVMDSFFDEKIGCPVRWLPGCRFRKSEPGEEEQTGRVDSWYLFHTLLNLARLAEFGKERERALFTRSLAYAMRTAHHFKYDWPVFFDMKTLRVHKRETAEGKGGERDVPGLYVHVMMQAWKLTREKQYLKEAETAARRLSGLGFGTLYQTNNTMFGALALAWLWKETGNSLYRDLSYVSVGSLLSHLWLWEPDVPGRSWRTFMGLPPLHDAPYIAAYEEAEVFACVAPYIAALGADAPASVVTLLVEYGKQLLDRSRYYFPDSLDPDSVCDSPREGWVDPTLTVPLEDLYPTDAKAGQVGQQGYGASLAMILAIRSYHRWKGVPYQVWCNAPLADERFEEGKTGSLGFRVVGSNRCEYEVRLIPAGKPPAVTISVEGKRKARIANDQGHALFRVRGGDTVAVRWKK